MLNFALFLFFTFIARLSATDLSVITTQIKELDENITITMRELTECRDEKNEILFEIEQVKGLLANEKMKDESKNLNLAEIRKLEDKLDDLVENQSNIDKTIVSFERIQKAHEDARNRLELDLKRYNQKHSEKFSISGQKDQGLHSIDLPQNESVQSVKNMSIDQNLTETQSTHNKCDLPYVPSQANPFLCDSSRQASKDINLYRDKNSHINSSRQASRDDSFDQNRSISDSFIEEKCSKPKNTDEKPEADLKQSSSIERLANGQVNDMETNINNEVNSKPQNNNVIEIFNPPITPSSNYQPIPLPRKGKLNSITKPTYSDNDENNFTPVSNSTLLGDTGSSVCEIDKISSVNEDPINTIKSGNLADFNQSEKNNENIPKNSISRNRSTHPAIGSSKPDIISIKNNKSDRDNGLKKLNLQKSNNEVHNKINVTGNTKLKNVDKNKNYVKLKKVDEIENDASLKTTMKKESVGRPKHVDISDKHKKPTDNAQYDNLNDKKEDKTINLTINQKKKASRKKNKSYNRNTLILKEKNEHINSDEEKSVDMPEDGYTTVNKHDNKSDSEDKSLNMDIIKEVDKFEKPLLSNGIKSDEKFDNIKFKTLCKEFLDSDKNNATPLQKNPTEQIIVDESKNDYPHINNPLESSILEANDKDINDIPTKEPSSCNDKNDHESSNLKIYIFVVVITLSAVGLFVITILILKKKSYEFIF